MATVFESASGEQVDFDFFATPRATESPGRSSPEPERKVYYKPPVSAKPAKNGDIDEKNTRNGKKKNKYSDSESDSSDSEIISEIGSDSDRSYSSDDSRRREKKSQSEKSDKGRPKSGRRVSPKYSDSDSYSNSSSAYSDNSSDDESNIIEKERQKNKQPSVESRYNRPSDRESHNRSKEAWGSGIQRIDIDVKPAKTDSENSVQRERPKSGRYDSRRANGKERNRHSSNGKSGSDSEMTDVSPLSSPRDNKAIELVQSSNDNGETTANDVQLQSKKLDLSILMEAVSEIDRQQRLKSNTRRVMFEPQKVKKDKGHFSFDNHRVKLIEKENQRLLKEIMKHIGPNKQKKKVVAVPQVKRVTPSAINRQRDQRRIELENMQMLQRLQKAKATRGMSRNDQLDEYQRTVLHGVPISAMHQEGPKDSDGTLMFDANSLRGMDSASVIGSRGRRSRPGSAKSNASSIRSRPSSAKSSASVISRCSVRSNRSAKSRPPWDDRFSYS